MPVKKSHAAIKPKALARWLETLPEMNPSVSVPAILDGLSRLTTLDAPDAARQNLLDVYRERVNRILADYDSARFQQAVRNAEDREHLTGKIAGLTSELARAYKLIVLHSHEKGENPKGKARFRRAIYCAMEQTVFGLLHAFRVYRPLPHGAHRNLHELYRLAEEHKALYVPVSFGDEPAPSQAIGKLYKQYLLFCIADPYHLGRTEVRPLFRSLSRYATAAQLTRKETCRETQGRFVVDLGGDEPPVPCARLQGWESLKDPVILDTTDVVSAALRDQINQAVSRRHRLLAQQGRRMLSHLVPHFQGAQLRQHERRPVQRAATLGIGLYDVHRLLGPEGKLLIRAVAEHGSLTAPVAGPPSKRPLLLSSWRVVDEAPGGLRLLGPRAALVEHQAGDLVAILDSQAHLGLAVIRWIRAEDDETVAVGVQHLRAPAVPVHCAPLDDEAGSAERIPCLLFSGTRDRRVPASLLTPTGVYSEGGALAVMQSAKTVRVSMGEHLAETAAFDRFCFEMLKTKA
jgi:hypothetical protein